MRKDPSTQAIAFTGHMIDLPDRKVQRFPPEGEADAAAAIEKTLRRHATEKMLGFASAARGGDILFHEAARAMGMQTYIVLPFTPEVFVETSVAGVKSGNWIERFWNLWSSTPMDRRVVLDAALSDEAYVLCNAKILSMASSHGPYRLIALWDGLDDSSAGGTAHMIATAKTKDIMVDIIPLGTT
jgi:hypothetical protein